MKRVNPFVTVTVIVLVVIGLYVYFTYIHKTPVDVQYYTEKAKVVRAYYEAGHSTLEDRTYFVELKTEKGDTLQAEGTVYYSVCKNKVGGYVTVVYQVTTYSDGTNKIVIQDVANVNSGHKQ